MKLFLYNDDIILIPDIVGKTKEVVWGVVKIQYEGRKPIHEASGFDNDSDTKFSKKTDKKTFLSQCFEDIKQYIENYINIWLSNPNLIVYWGVRGFNVRKQLNNKLTTLVDLYPE